MLPEVLFRSISEVGISFCLDALTLGQDLIELFDGIVTGRGIPYDVSADGQKF